MKRSARARNRVLVPRRRAGGLGPLLLLQVGGSCGSCDPYIPKPSAVAATTTAATTTATTDSLHRLETGTKKRGCLPKCTVKDIKAKRDSLEKRLFCSGSMNQQVAHVRNKLLACMFVQSFTSRGLEVKHTEYAAQIYTATAGRFLHPPRRNALNMPSSRAGLHSPMKSQVAGRMQGCVFGPVSSGAEMALLMLRHDQCGPWQIGIALRRSASWPRRRCWNGRAKLTWKSWQRIQSKRKIPHPEHKPTGTGRGSTVCPAALPAPGDTLEWPATSSFPRCTSP